MRLFRIIRDHGSKSQFLLTNGSANRNRCIICAYFIYLRCVVLQMITMPDEKQKARSEVASFRFPIELLEKLRKGASIRKISVNSYVTQALYSYVDVYEPSTAAGMFPFPKKLVSSMLNALDDKTIAEMSKQMAYNDLVDLAYLNPNSKSGESFITNVLAWANHSGFAVQDIFEDSQRTLVLKHNMGEKWSLFLSKSLQGYFDHFKVEGVRFEIPNDMLVMRIPSK